MFSELDIVTAKRALSPAVPAGCIGTIVMVHSTDGFEVEFMERGETVDVLTVHRDDILWKQSRWDRTKVF